MFRLSWTIIVQGLDATSVGADQHFENQFNASIPALIDGSAEYGK
jgi:hypothetical protein